MITAALKLRFGQRPLREPAAWYLPGGDPAGWLEEIALWHAPHEAIRIYPVPSSASDRRPQGALLVAGERQVGNKQTFEASRQTFVASRRCIPFGRIAGRLFVPVEASLDPEVSDAELRELLPEGYAHVWHPAVGLIAYEPADALKAADLLSFHPPLRRAWDGAVPGVAFAQRLLSLAPDAELFSFESIISEGRDDIGTESDAWNELPPDPAEPRDDAAGKIARGLTRAAANIARWLTHKPPGSGASPNWVNNLAKWADKKLAGVAANLDALRNKEILRLMKLLETDPDQGLRFALPLAGDAAHRGVAPPGGRLGERNVNFNLGRLGGGQATDFWDIQAQHRANLLAKYRELAAREVRLGRHRRAAYIHAELLGDLNAAALVLTEGQHWREAAVIYRDRLKRPLDAARCLERGGLWTEAIGLYEELGEFEKAGDLYLQIEQREAADVQFRKAVEKHQQQGDLIAAARLLDEKLRVPDEALAELASGWPDSRQAGQCLKGTFGMLGRLGRHEQSQQWLRRFRDGDVPPHRLVQLADILADTARNYPDQRITHEAADCTRRLVSAGLTASQSSGDTSDARQLLASLGRLVPEDRLLGRDCQRFLLQHAARPKPVVKPASDKKRPRLVRTIQLPAGVKWKSAIACGETIYAVGYRGYRLHLIRCNWEGVQDTSLEPWKVEANRAELPLILSAAPEGDEHVLVHLVFNNSLLGERLFSQSDAFPQHLRAGAMTGITTHTVAACRRHRGTVWTLETANGELVLADLGPLGHLGSTQTVPLPDGIKYFGLVETGFPLPLHARGDSVYVGLGNHLTIINKKSGGETIPFAERITALTGSAPNTRSRVVLTFTRGAAVLWDDFEGRKFETLAPDMTEPVACINRGGYLILANGRGCEIYSTSSRHARLVGELDLILSQPIAVLSAPRTDQFAIVNGDGRIGVYELP